MNINIDNRNELLKRREIEVVVEKSENPGFEKIKEDLAAHFKEEVDKIVVNNVYSKFGSGFFHIKAMIYDSKEDRERIEPKVRVKKGGKK
jgi:ribosomal protein S24E